MFKTISNTPMDFETFGSVRMRIIGTGQIIIGTGTPATSAVLELASTDKALLLTRLTTTQRDTLTTVNGMIIYNSTLNKIQVRENGVWISTEVGDVVGPIGAVNDRFASFSGSSGKLIKDSGVKSVDLEFKVNKAQADGYAPLDSATLLPLINLPAHKSNHVSGGSDPFVLADILEASSRGVRVSLRNATGSTLNKGDLVAVTGFDITEGRPTVILADKDLSTTRPAIAVVEASVPNNTNFEGLVVGLLTGLNTSSFVVNAQLALGDNGQVSQPPPDVDPFTGEVQLIGSVVRSDVTNGSIYFSLSSTLLPMTAAQTFWVKEAATTGIISGGDVTRVGAPSLNVAVASGTGFVNTGGTLFRVTWSAVSPLALTLSDTNFIFVDSAGVVKTSLSLPNLESNIILATAITDATSVVFLSNHKVLLPERAAKFHKYTREIVGPITVSGLITKKDAIDLRLEVEGGDFYTRDFRVTVPPTDPITFTYWFRDGAGGFTRLLNQTTIDPERFDNNSGTLVTMPAGNFKKDLLFIAPTSSGAVEYHIFYGQETFATQSAAEAGNLPAADSDVLENSIRSGGIVVQEGQGTPVIASVVDVRPFLGQLSPGTTAVTDHSLLSGLSGDDHPVYLPADGSRPMTGSLDMGANTITNVGNVDGVDVSAHAARHTNGSDDIQSATAAQKGLATAVQISKLDGIETAAKDDQNAVDVPIADAGARYTGTEVEAALQEIAGAGRTTETVKANTDATALNTTHRTGDGS
ncbi:MAG: hypothetical protein V3S69_00010, partial [Dehalococcoidales bacterium]